MIHLSRREFVRRAAAGWAVLSNSPRLFAAETPSTENTCKFGLVTYLWGKDLTLPELISACEKSNVLGVELRTTHRHGVEPSLTAAERRTIRARFTDSPVMLVGLGSDERFDAPNPQLVRQSLENAKAFVQLSHDVGGTGVKVKGDNFHATVPREETLRQVVASLQELGDFAAKFGQEIRLEVHGGFRDLPIHHEIISRVDHPQVRTCWNSNPQDLEGAGLEANFELVADYFGQTAHVRQLNDQDYPWAELIELFVRHKYSGWILLEAHGNLQVDEVATKLAEQRQLFQHYFDRATQATRG